MGVGYTLLLYTGTILKKHFAFLGWPVVKVFCPQKFPKTLCVYCISNFGPVQAWEGRAARQQRGVGEGCGKGYSYHGIFLF